MYMRQKTFFSGRAEAAGARPPGAASSPVLLVDVEPVGRGVGEANELVVDLDVDLEVALANERLGDGVVRELRVKVGQVQLPIDVRVERRRVAPVVQLLPVDAVKERVARDLLGVARPAAQPLGRIPLQQLCDTWIAGSACWASAPSGAQSAYECVRRPTWLMRLRALSETVAGKRSFSFRIFSYISLASRE